MKKVLAVALAVGLMSFGASALTIGGVTVYDAGEKTLWELIDGLGSDHVLLMSMAGNCPPAAYNGTFSQAFTIEIVDTIAANTDEESLGWYQVAGPATGAIVAGTPYSPGFAYGFSLNSAWYSQSALNSGGYTAMLLFDVGDKTYMAWEDAGPNGDQDYNDFVAEVIFRPCGDDPVPEPATLSLLGIGLAGLVMRRRRG